MARALHMKMLFHWPKKSAVDAIGQNSPKGTIHIVATTTLLRSRNAGTAHAQMSEPMNTTPVTSPKMPVSPANWI